MSVLIYTESEQGKFKKAALEVASYAKAVATQLGTTVTAISFNVNDASVLGTYGVDKILNVSNEKLSAFNANGYAQAIKQAAEKERTKVVILSSSADSKYLAPLLAASIMPGPPPVMMVNPSSASLRDSASAF